MNYGFISLMVIAGLIVGFLTSAFMCIKTTRRMCDKSKMKIMNFSKYNKDMEKLAQDIEFTEITKDNGTDISMDT